MILVDTSVWIDHFRAADRHLAALLDTNSVVSHPFVIGEIALGSVRDRRQILRYLGNLPSAEIATHHKVMTFIDAHKLANTGLGYVDACLLASAALTPESSLWSRDKNLMAQAARCRLSAAI